MFYWHSEGKKSILSFFFITIMWKWSCVVVNRAQKEVNKERENNLEGAVSGSFGIITVNSFFMKIGSHFSSRGFSAFAPDVRRHESSENCQKCCSPFPLRIYISFTEWFGEHQSKERLGAQWTKVGQYVQLGLNVFLAYPAPKYFLLEWNRGSHLSEDTW